MDQGFVGLILSVFNANTATKEQTVQVTAFQAVQGAAEPHQLQVASSTELDGLDEQMKAALAASAAGTCVQTSRHLCCVPFLFTMLLLWIRSVQLASIIAVGRFMQQRPFKGANSVYCIAHCHCSTAVVCYRRRPAAISAGQLASQGGAACCVL